VRKTDLDPNLVVFATRALASDLPLLEGIDGSGRVFGASIDITEATRANRWMANGVVPNVTQIGTQRGRNEGWRPVVDRKKHQKMGRIRTSSPQSISRADVKVRQTRTNEEKGIGLSNTRVDRHMQIRLDGGLKVWTEEAGIVLENRGADCRTR
jgi:hypothetical protein